MNLVLVDEVREMPESRPSGDRPGSLLLHSKVYEMAIRFSRYFICVKLISRS